MRAERIGAAVLIIAEAITLAGCSARPVTIATAPRALEARELAGTWSVAATNFPLWLEGDKSDPRFRYAVLPPEDKVARLDDEVSYLDVDSGERETIDGTDTQDPGASAHFTWRGDGLLALFKSEWYVAAMAPDRRWAILYFTATIATPEGVDIIARSPPLDPDAKSAALAILEGDPFLRAKAKGLVWLSPTPTPR